MIPQEHQLKCETCGKVIDMRDLGQVLSHGMMNKETGRYECEEIDRDIPYSTSRKTGDSIEWTKDKQPIHNN